MSHRPSTKEELMVLLAIALSWVFLAIAFSVVSTFWCEDASASPYEAPCYVDLQEVVQGQGVNLKEALRCTVTPSGELIVNEPDQKEKPKEPPKAPPKGQGQQIIVSQ